MIAELSDAGIVEDEIVDVKFSIKAEAREVQTILEGVHIMIQNMKKSGLLGKNVKRIESMVEIG